MYHFRILTRGEVNIEGLRLNMSAGLVVKSTFGKGRGVYAREDIPENTFITEYKYEK